MKEYSSSMKLFVTFCIVLIVSGCAGGSGSVVGVGYSDSQGTQYAPSPDFAKVFFYRDSAGGASLSTDYIIGERPVRVEEDGKSMAVRVNGELAGHTTIRTYFRFDLPAGHYVFNSQGRRTKLILDVENGGVYFIQQKDDVTRMGAGSRLTLVEPERGKKGVAIARYLPSSIETILRHKNANAESDS